MIFILCMNAQEGGLQKCAHL